ncbi:MAG TPA: hypothetical protein PLZ84_03030 [Clostridia bacterium]|nr:hypothetical protein [Clostridia bacterium]
MNLVPLKELLKKYKIKPDILITVIIFAMIGLLFLSTFRKGNENNTDNIESSNINITKDDAAAFEKKIADTLSAIKGAGKVKVMVTYESSPEIVPVYSVDKETDTTEGGDVITRQERERSSPATLNDNGKTKAFVLKELNPEIRGVIVIAEGANDIGVRLKLQQAVVTVLNITPDRVDVFEMN